MTDAPTTPDPIEIAMEAEASGRQPSEAAARFLARQERLVGWQIASERAGFALKVLTAAAGLAAAGVLGAMAWSAHRDDSLVIDPIGAPADLAQQGSTGGALAHALQDKLVNLQAETLTQYASAQVHDHAGAELKVQIPASGVSLSDLDLALRQALGRQTHVSAEVTRVVSGPESGALALSARVGGQSGVRLVQPDGNLDALIGRAAEYVYGASDPLRYSDWLVQHQRDEQASALLQRLTREGSDMDRAEAYYKLSYVRANDASILRKRDFLARAVALSNGLIGLNDYAVTEGQLGHDEAAYLGYARSVSMAAAIRKTMASTEKMTPQAWTFRELVTRGNVGRSLGDHAARMATACFQLKVAPCDAAALVRAAQINPGQSDPSRDPRLNTAAQAMAQLHDLKSASALIAARPITPTVAGEPILTEQDRAAWLTARLLLESEREDWPALLHDADVLDAQPDRTGGAHIYSASSRRILAFAAMGDAAGVARVGAAMAPDCYRCQILRGQAAARLRDWAGADRWFAQAVRLGPSLPLAEAEWARALIAQGRPDSAIVQAVKAVKKGPRFADPLEYWGEALLAKGDAKGAARKFADAAKLTPNWARLHLKWGEALARQGKPDEARAQWRLAAALDLTAAERAELARVMR